jgi:hypothetical protein
VQFLVGFGEDVGGFEEAHPVVEIGLSEAFTNCVDGLCSGRRRERDLVRRDSDNRSFYYEREVGKVTAFYIYSKTYRTSCAVLAARYGNCFEEQL